MVRVAFHALFFLGVEAVSLQTTSTQDHSIPQTYLPFCFLFVLFQLYADSSSYFYVSGIGSTIAFMLLPLLESCFPTTFVP